MKVLFFTTSGNYNGGGVMCLVEMLKHIDRHTIEPHVVMPNHGSTEAKLKELNIPYTIIRSYDWLYPETVLRSLSFRLKRPLRWFINQVAEIRTYVLMKTHKFDAYHLNSIYSNFGVRSAMSLKIPVFWHLREFSDEHRWTPYFIDEEYSYRTIEKANQLIAVSNCIKDYYQSKMPAANINVIYDGVDFDKSMICRDIITFHSPLRLSMIGGITEVKGHEDALRAVCLLKKRNVDCRLTIYGRCRDMSYLNELKDLITELNIEDNVNFAGNQTDMTIVWQDTDIVLVCSKSESFGRVAVEAMYQNIPVIGADNTGTFELINEDTIGCHYNTGNAEDLCDKIIAITKRAFNDTAKELNHKRAQNYSAEQSAANLCNLFVRFVSI